MINAHEFLAACRSRGWNFFSGTPCSYLQPLINAAIEDPGLIFRDATNEGDAVALAAGSFVATGAPGVVMFQNSGLGNAVNALTSLNWPFRIPVLLVVTHRGQPGGPPDEPQHELMGEITTSLLDTLRVPWATFPQTTMEVGSTLERAAAHFRISERPYALVMPHSSVADRRLAFRPGEPPLGARTFSFAESLRRATADRATRAEALSVILAARRPDDIVVATTGFTGRELYTMGDAPNHFYLVGSMGSASSFALGLAVRQPTRRIVLIDGDGAVLMRMGNLASIGAGAPRNLFHLVLDNEVHDSTGGQATASRGVSFGAIAQACGYAQAAGTDEVRELAQYAAAHTVDSGPTLLHFRIRRGTLANLGRPKIAPAAAARRLMRELGVAPRSDNG